MITWTGNLWEANASHRAITTNGVVKADGRLVMGAGIAKQALDLYPGIDMVLGRYVKTYGNRCIILHADHIISFPTKNHWRDKSDISLIITSCKQIAEIADKFKISSIAIVKPGCQNGGLLWSDVRPVIEPLLDDRFIVCV